MAVLPVPRYLSREKVLFVVEQWSKRHPVSNLEGGTVHNDLIKIYMHNKESLPGSGQEIDRAVASQLNVEEISDLEVMYYIGRDTAVFSNYEAYLGETIVKNSKTTVLEHDIVHLLSKANLLEALVRACNVIGCPKLGDELAALRPGAV